jgi:hypothetical protein
MNTCIGNNIEQLIKMIQNEDVWKTYLVSWGGEGINWLMR